METLFNYPEYAEIDGKKYKINTDYRVAIKCNDISLQDIPMQEKVMAIIYLLFGDEGLQDMKHYNELMEKANYFLKCGNINEEEPSKEEPDMDLIQDFPYIEASFMSDYGMSIKDKPMHWWEFYFLLCGLSQSAFGNSCVLNRIRDLRTLDLNKISDPKEREKLRKAKEQFALKKRNEKKKEYTQKEIDAMEEYHKLIGD
jgi:hypothetical protein